MPHRKTLMLLQETKNEGRKMKYRDSKRREIRTELRKWTPITSAEELYEMGKAICESEERDRLYPLRGCPWAPRTPLGEVAVQRYNREKPERRLP